MTSSGFLAARYQLLSSLDLLSAAVLDRAARVHNLLKGISLPGQVEGDIPSRASGGGEAASPGGGVVAWAGGGDWTRAGGGELGWADCGGGGAAAPGGGDWTSLDGGELGCADGGGGDAAGGSGDAAAPGGGDWTSSGGGEDVWEPGGGLGKNGIGGLLTCGLATVVPHYMAVRRHCWPMQGIWIVAGICLGQMQAACRCGADFAWNP